MDLVLGAKDSGSSPGVGYVLIVRRAADGFVVDFDDATFKAYGSATTPLGSLVEDAQVSGIWTIAVPTVLDAATAWSGTADLILKETPVGVVHSTRSVAFVDGVSLIDLARPEVLLGTHTGGIDALQILGSNGQPVVDAVIRVFKSADYVASDPEKNILGLTTSNAQGHWRDSIPVATGYSYVVHVSKSTEIGVQSVTVSV